MDSHVKTSFAVLGCGSWGTALAILLAKNGHTVILWGRNQKHISTFILERENKRYLPGIPFPESLTLSYDLSACVSHVKNILVVVPSHAFRATIAAIHPHLTSNVTLAWATKGLEKGSNKLLHEVIAEEINLPLPTAIVSGPTFAKETANGLPTAITVASQDDDFAQNYATWLHNDTFRAYTCRDVVGVEIGGAVKNVLAVAAGIADGLGFGANTRAALVTRGLAEMIRLGIAMGGQQETFMGLAGLGDLVLTCTDNASRNRRFGLALGQGKSITQSLESIDQVVEGIQTTLEIHRLAQSLQVEMPIVEQVYRVLYESLQPEDAVYALLQREQKAE